MKKFMFEIHSENNIPTMEQMSWRLLDILSQTGDFRHSNIVYYESPEEDLIKVDAFPNDFKDNARSYQALKEMMNYIIDQLT